MPLVHIDMMEGRSPEQIERMVAAVSEALAESLPAPIDTVRVVVNEMEPHQYGIGGVPFTEVKRRRAAAAESATDA
jgi:4-oxalocrotonate tautomerase